MFVCWQNIQSDCFGIANDVRQDSLLSPFLFRFYIRDLLKAVVSSDIGCCVAGTFINIFNFIHHKMVAHKKKKNTNIINNTADGKT